MGTRWAARYFEHLYRLMSLALPHRKSTLTLKTAVQANRWRALASVQLTLIPGHRAGQASSTRLL